MRGADGQPMELWQVEMIAGSKVVSAWRGEAGSREEAMALARAEVASLANAENLAAGRLPDGFEGPLGEMAPRYGGLLGPGRSRAAR